MAATSWLVRALLASLRYRIDDRAGLDACAGPVIAICWHNRVLTIPYAQSRYYKRPFIVLTSMSKDGDVVEAMMRPLGIGVVRGSTSRRGGHAMLEMAGAIERGSDIGITPDGPRGPCYHLGRGAIVLARLTGAPILPCHVRYSRCVRLKSWDAFMLPLPFARVDITLLPLEKIAPGDDEALERERARIESILRQD